MKKDNKTERYTYNKYIEDVEFYKRTSPFENTFQIVVEELLRDIIEGTKIELIISDKFRRKSTKEHCVKGYKKEGTASPDLLLAKNFSYYNLTENDAAEKRLSKTKFYTYIEVKKPGKINLTDKDEILYNLHDKNQIRTYLKHPNGHKVIFTDIYTWAFYDNDFKDPLIIKLYQEDTWGNTEQWNGLYGQLRSFVFTNEESIYSKL